jgi:hypothetical protein
VPEHYNQIISNGYVKISYQSTNSGKKNTLSGNDMPQPPYIVIQYGWPFSLMSIQISVHPYRQRAYGK